MRRFLFPIIICLCLSILVGCSDSNDSPSIIVNDLGEYHNILNAVLQNQKTFITGKNTAVYLKNYEPDNNGGETPVPVDPFEYAFIDLDGDTVEEMVINISEATGVYLILHYNGHDVFGYETNFRSLSSIKTDGSFLGSDGAETSYFCRLSFAGQKLNVTKEAIMDTAEGLFQIDGRNVSKEEVLEFSDNWHKKQDITWTSLKEPAASIETTAPTIQETVPETVTPVIEPSQSTIPTDNISLNDYVSVEFYGYNRAGMATVRFDKTKFLAEQADRIQFKSDSAKEEYRNATGDLSEPAEVLYNLIKITLSQEEGLSNGDAVSLQWKVSTSKIEKYFTVNLTYQTKSYTVSQLTIPDDFNPFEYITVTYTGTAPCGDLKISVDTSNVQDGWLADKIAFACDSKSFACSPETITQPGQEVRITYTAVDIQDNKSLIKYIDTYGLIPTQTQYCYKLSGFDYYPETFSQLDVGILEEADRQCRSKLSAKNSLQISNITRTTAYYVTPTDRTAETDRSLYVVYRVDAAAEFWNLDNAPVIHRNVTFYYVLEIRSVKVLVNGETTYGNISTTINPIGQSEGVYFTCWEVDGQISETAPDAATGNITQYFYCADGFASAADAERAIRNCGGQLEKISN